jgi:hypothetical protein
MQVLTRKSTINRGFSSKPSTGNYSIFTHNWGGLLCTHLWQEHLLETLCEAGSREPFGGTDCYPPRTQFDVRFLPEKMLILEPLANIVTIVYFFNFPLRKSKEFRKQQTRRAHVVRRPHCFCVFHIRLSPNVLEDQSAKRWRLMNWAQKMAFVLMLACTDPTFKGSFQHPRGKTH